MVRFSFLQTGYSVFLFAIPAGLYYYASDSLRRRLGIVHVHHPDNPHGPSFIPPQTAARASRALSISYSPLSQVYSTSNTQEQERLGPGPLLSRSCASMSSELQHNTTLKKRVEKLSVVVTELKHRPPLKLTASERVIHKDKEGGENFEATHSSPMIVRTSSAGLYWLSVLHQRYLARYYEGIFICIFFIVALILVLLFSDTLDIISHYASYSMR